MRTLVPLTSKAGTSPTGSLKTTVHRVLVTDVTETSYTLLNPSSSS